MKYQESETVELKMDHSESIPKDIIAFANTDGGTIYIGIRDNGEVNGVVSPDRMIQRIANAVRDTIRPDVTMFVHYDTEDTGNAQLVRITVSRGTGRPYYMAEKGMIPSGVFVRQGTASAPATEAAIRQMIKDTDGDSYEDRRSLQQDLNFSYATDAFLKRGLELGRTQMITMGMLTNEGIYTDLALLLSDQCPHIIKAAAFSGTDQAVFQDRREFSGSLLKQIDDAYAFLEMRNEKAATFEGIRRIDHPAYPEAALREALLNAVVHRDYSYSASTLINCYPDRIEFISAGGLVQGFTLEDVLMGLSICRNPKLASVFYRLNLIEAYGTGLKKIADSYIEYAPAVLFQTSGKVFKTTLPRLPWTGKETVSRRDHNEDRILSALTGTNTITRTEVEHLTGLSTSSAVRLLKRMVEQGDLIVTGGGKSTRYRRFSR